VFVRTPVFVDYGSKCPCVHLFVMHLVVSETRDETSELVRARQIQKNRGRSSRMDD